MEDYEIKISQFVDGELPAKGQTELFTFLSNNENARKTLADYIELKKEAKSFYTELNTEFDNSEMINNVLANGNTEKKRYKIGFYISAAAVILLAFLLFSNISKNNIDSQKYLKLQTKYSLLQGNYNSILSEKIELIKLTKNLSFKIEESKSKQVSLNSESTLKKKNPNAKRKQPVRRVFQGMNAYAANIPVYRITKDDFLGQQIIGN